LLEREDGTSYAGEWPVQGGNSPEIDKVEVRFRGTKGDQGRKKAVKRGWEQGGRNRRAVVGTVLDASREVYSPLMAYRGYGWWQVWARGQATDCLRCGLPLMAEAWEREG